MEKLETIHRMTRRCLGWDYRQRAIYQITLVQAERRKPLLGRLEVKGADGDWGLAPPARDKEAAGAVPGAQALGCRPEAVEARVVPSELGAAIAAHWKRMGEFTPEIRPLACQIMPDHLHGILEVQRPMKRPLGNAIGGFKTGCGKIFRGLMPAARDSLLFEKGFQDTILFREGQLEAMFAYLRDNPRRLAVKRMFPELFRVSDAVRVGLGGGCRGWFSALGNRFLLGRELLAVQVSRRDFAYRREAKAGGRGMKIERDAAGRALVEEATEAFGAKRDALLAAARHGAVLLSPCVSDGEREIAREAFEAGMPLAAMRNQGFGAVEKPSGRLFDACAAGRLLLLSPVGWPHVTGEKAMARMDALAMNRLCRWLAGEGRPGCGKAQDPVEARALEAVRAEPVAEG